MTSLRREKARRLIVFLEVAAITVATMTATTMLGTIGSLIVNVIVDIALITRIMVGGKDLP